MNYAIFRSEPIYTLNDLAQIGSHNRREKQKYDSNPDIKHELTKNNFDVIPLDKKYVQAFKELTKEYKKEHDERMKTEREDRKKSFSRMLDQSKNVVADELLFTASHDFFNDMTQEQIKEWATCNIKFVLHTLGYKREQILHATVHMDEKTPHMHCVVVPLVKKLDKRTSTERYTISKKQYIKDKLHLSQLQDKYWEIMNANGYDLERGIKNFDKEHISIKEYKKITRKINHELNNKNDKLNSAIKELEDNMATNKNIIFDKDNVKISKETFNSMNKVISETNKILEVQPKLQKVFDEVDSYSKSFRRMEKENKSLTKKVENLKDKNNELKKENQNLWETVQDILTRLIKFFRNILIHGNEKSKDLATEQIKYHYDKEDFDDKDVYKISKGTTKQDELFEYSNIPNYMKEPLYKNDSEKSNDFER